MDKYNVYKLTEDKFQLWQNFAEKSPQNNIFNSIKWLRLISSVKNTEFHIIGSFKSQELVGGCALYLESSMEGKIAKFAPLSQYGGILLSDQESDYLHKRQKHNQEIVDSLISYIEENYDYVNLINHPSLVDVRPFIWKGWNVDIRYTCYTKGEQLSPDIVRRAAIAAKNGIKVSEIFEPETFYRLWSNTFKTKGIKPPLDLSEFCKLTRELKADNVLRMFCTTTSSQEIISAVLLLLDKDTVYYWQAASDPEYLNLGGNQLLIETITKDLKDKKLVMDLAGADIESISFYKSSFADRLVSHYRVSKAISLRAKTFQLGKKMYHASKGVLNVK